MVGDKENDSWDRSKILDEDSIFCILSYRYLHWLVLFHFPCWSWLHRVYYYHRSVMDLLWNLLSFFWSASLHGTDAKCILELGDVMVDKAIVALKANVSKDPLGRWFHDVKSIHYYQKNAIACTYVSETSLQTSFWGREKTSYGRRGAEDQILRGIRVDIVQRWWRAEP